MIYLVSCTRRKAHVPAMSPPLRLEARDLYVSDWFTKARAYVEGQIEREPGSRWFILSALHGLLEPTHRLMPYDATLSPYRDVRFEQWAKPVEQQLVTIVGEQPQSVTFLAGERYREPLAEMLRARRWKVETPLARYGIGEQLAWFKKRLQEV